MAHSSCEKASSQSFPTLSKPCNSENPTQNWKANFQSEELEKIERGNFASSIKYNDNMKLNMDCINKETHS